MYNFMVTRRRKHVMEDTKYNNITTSLNSTLMQLDNAGV